MSCKEVKNTKYQTRKSPAFHAGNCKGLTKKGKNGEYVSKANSRGIYKWIKTAKTATKGKKAYLIHNNGARPFRVEVSGKHVEIYKGTANGTSMDYNILIKSLTVKDVHVGKYSGAFGLGNSLLLDLGEKKYIHIGFDIYEFKMEDDFEAYYSLIGNSDVPYPVLLGSKYVYFMLDYKYVPRSLFKGKMNAKEWEDAYQYYYGYKDYETGSIIDEAIRKEKVQKINKAYSKKFKNMKRVL
jgi:hypothetical protein